MNNNVEKSRLQICVTRFNDETFKQNQSYRNENKIKCIYGTPVKITENILPSTNIMVIEMNNSKNIIEGFGIIKNKLAPSPNGKRCHYIYNDNNYNRYIYKSNNRIDKDDLNKDEKKIIRKLEDILFKTKGHMKRGQGIQNIPDKIKKNKDFNYVKFLKELYSSKEHK